MLINHSCKTVRTGGTERIYMSEGIYFPPPPPLPATHALFGCGFFHILSQVGFAGSVNASHIVRPPVLIPASLDAH